MKETTINLNGLNLFYLDTELGNKTILCLHGRWGRGKTWSGFMERYQDRYRIIAPDQRGHGLSDKPLTGYTGEDLATDACELIKQLNCAPVIVVGHSMGGKVAAHLAALYPQLVKALAILDETSEGNPDASVCPIEEAPTVDEFTANWPTPYATYEDAISDLRQRFPRETNLQYFKDSLTETPQGYDFLFSRRAMAALAHYNRDWHHLLSRIACPTLLVRAADSWCLSKEASDRMVSTIRDVTYFEVPDSDHMVYADNDDAFYPPFEQFLKRVTG